MTSTLQRRQREMKRLLDLIPDVNAPIHLKTVRSQGFFKLEQFAWLKARATLDQLHERTKLQQLRNEQSFEPAMIQASDLPLASLLWLPVQWQLSTVNRPLMLGPRGAHRSSDQRTVATPGSLWTDLRRGIWISLLLDPGQLSENEMRQVTQVREDDHTDLVGLLTLALPASVQEVALSWNVTLPEHPGLRLSQFALQTLRDEHDAVFVQTLPGHDSPLAWIGTEHLWKLSPGLASALVSEARARLTVQGQLRLKRGLSHSWSYSDAWHLMTCLREGRLAATSGRRAWQLQQFMADFTNLGGVILPHDAAFYTDLEQRSLRHNADYGVMPTSYLLSPGLHAARTRHEQVAQISALAGHLKIF